MRAGVDGTVRLWDLSTSKPLACYSGHSGPVWSVDYSADCNVVASGGADNTVRLWDARPTDAALRPAAAAADDAAAPVPYAMLPLWLK